MRSSSNSPESSLEEETLELQQSTSVSIANLKLKPELQSESNLGKWCKSSSLNNFIPLDKFVPPPLVHEEVHQRGNAAVVSLALGMMPGMGMG